MQMQVHNYEIYVHCDTLIDVLDDDDDDEKWYSKIVFAIVYCHR